MIALGIILLVLLILALLRVGVIIRYNDAGLALWLKIGLIKLRLQTDGEAKAKKKIKPKRDLSSIKPGNFGDFKEMFKAAKKALARIRRKLLIKKLILHYTSAGEDPATVALQFGAANAAFGVIIPVLEKSFRIKRRDIRASADFDTAEPKIYALISISIAIWEIIYILPALMAVFAKPQGKNNAKSQTDSDDFKRKGGQQYGKTTTERHDGNDDAKGKGDDRRKRNSRRTDHSPGRVDAHTRV